MFDEQPPPAPLTHALEVMRRIWAVDHAARRLSRVMEAELGVTGPQRLVVRIVGQRPGISAGELCALLHLDASTLSGHLQSLSDAGILERRPSPTDARKACISLTPKGKRFDVQTPGTVEAAVESVLAGVDPRSLGHVERFLETLVAALDKQTVECERATREKKRRRRRT